MRARAVERGVDLALGAREECGEFERHPAGERAHEADGALVIGQVGMAAAAPERVQMVDGRRGQWRRPGGVP